MSKRLLYLAFQNKPKSVGPLRINLIIQNMALSINSVIHYTERLENLIGIIRSQGFRIKYCMEDIDMQLEITIAAAFPMVSFCDIPLSEVKNHIDSYGSFGIGLNKFWAKKSSLNPVLYLETDSNLSTHLRGRVNKILETVEKIEDKKSFELTDFDSMKDLTILISYFKNYEGKLIRGKINSDTYRFYDEREWRYVPTDKELNSAPSILYGPDYSQDKDVNNKLIENLFLKFTHTDISYIIVDSENDIPDILTVLNEVFENICTARELKILSTKIITKNQIYNDF